MTEEKYPYDWVELFQRRNVKIDIPKDDMFWLVIHFARHNPEAVKAILKVLEARHRINCPFPFACKRFPCPSLCCNANSLDCGGVAYRRS